MSTATPIPRALLVALCATTILLPALGSAQNLGDRLRRTAERAAESEVQRETDRQTRRVVRCAMGDERCAREARAAGHQVEYTQAAGSGGSTGSAGSAAGGADHPLIVPYAGSTLRQRQADAYNEYQRIIGHDTRARAVQTQRLEGRLTRLRYDNPRGRSTFEILANYRSALEARGYSVDWECTGRDPCGSTRNPGWNTINGMNVGIAGDLRYITGKLRWNDGEAYVSVAVNPQITYVHVLEAAAMDTGLVAVDAAALSAGLERDGRIELQGIYFETGRATLQPESRPALEQVAQLLRAQPGLRLNIVGHTDSVGGDAANLRLSQQRAEAVRLALTAQYGIDGERLRAQGVGSALPVAGNDTEEGRARNRRVELVKL